MGSDIPETSPQPLPFPARKRGPVRTVIRWAISLTVAAVVGSVLLVLVNAVLPPVITPLMLIRGFENTDGTGKFRWRWRDRESISPHIFRAVMAAEDARFCEHSGFDWKAVERAFRHADRGNKLRGASTISQQVAKNVYLWPGRSYFRKGLEAWFTVLIEALWSKDRILETYVNVAEWGQGIYGVEAAARFHFRGNAKTLSPRQAALLAATLPNPRRWAAGRPTGYINRRAGTIQARMRAFAVRSGDFCDTPPRK